MITEDTYTIPDWDGPVALSIEEYREVQSYDALNRPVFHEVGRSGQGTSSVSYGYDRRGLLTSVVIGTPGHVDQAIVSSIAYNSKGQRDSIVYGNGTETGYEYEPDTFRLKKIRTRKSAEVLQDLGYVYDPSGNIMRITNASEDATYFNNQVVSGDQVFEYDALYRLSLSTGREHMGQSGVHVSQPDSQHDVHRVALPHPGNGQAMQSYRQHYVYDSVGNMRSMRHVSGLGSFTHRWTKHFRYNNSTLDRNALGVAATERENNQLLEYEVGGLTQGYDYDAHGSMDALQSTGYGMVWDGFDRLHFMDLPSGTSHYWYTGDGQRSRKVLTDGDRILSERIYMGSLEVYREYDAQGEVKLERESFHVQDDTERMAMVDTKTIDHPADDTEEHLIRYQYGNHIGSSGLELDGAGNVISYEEYYAFGGTSYQAVDQAIKSASKRYRYTGMERDEESGMNYHTARYYLPWLCRWSSADPLGLIDGVNLYRYSRNNPVKFYDSQGTDPPDDDPPVVVTPLLTDSSVSGSLNFASSPSGLVPRSTSFSGTMRSSFQLRVPSLDMNTTGLADVDFSLNSDLITDTSYFNANGWMVLGSVSGLNVVTSGEVNLVGPTDGSLTQTTGNLQLQGSVGFSSFSLGRFGGDATLSNGNFQASVHATSVANLVRLNADATGTISDSGQINFTNLSGEFHAGVPGLNVDGNVSGASNQDGGLDLSANAQLRILGIPSLSIQGSGSLSQDGYDFSGAYSGYIPPLSYATGNFSLSSTTGIDADAHVFGLTYTPELKVKDPAPLPAPLRDALGEDEGPSSPPSGLTLGYSYSRYNRGAFTHFSAGIMTNDFSTFGVGAYLRTPF